MHKKGVYYITVFAPFWYHAFLYAIIQPLISLFNVKIDTNVASSSGYSHSDLSLSCFIESDLR